MPDILIEPERIIVDYVVSGTNDDRLLELRAHSVTRNSVLAGAWSQAPADFDTTLSIDSSSIGWESIMKSLFDLIHAHMSRGRPIEELMNPSVLGHLESPMGLRAFIREAEKSTRALPMPNERGGRFDEQLVLLAGFIFGVGITPFPESIDQFWAALGIDDLVSKVKWISERQTHLAAAGPLMALAHYHDWLATRGKSPGNCRLSGL